MKRIYVVGSITGKDDFETSDNINNMVDECQAVIEAGYAVYFPFTEVLNKLNNNIHFPIKPNDTAYEWLKVSDGVLLVGDWSKSDNCMSQVEVAENFNIPVFFDIPAIVDHFDLTKREEETVTPDRTWPARIFVKKDGMLGLRKGDCLELNYEEDRYEFNSELKHVNGTYDKRTAAISTSLYDRFSKLFTL